MQRSRFCSSRQIVTVLLSLGATALSTQVGRADEKETGKDAAIKLAEEWVFKGEEVKRTGQSRKHRYSANLEGTFCAYSVRYRNVASFDDVWKFYAKKCGATDVAPSIGSAGADNADGHRYAINRWPSEKQRVTTFALRTEEYTVMVNFMDASGGEDNTELHVQIVATIH